MDFVLGVIGLSSVILGILTVALFAEAVYRDFIQRRKP